MSDQDVSAVVFNRIEFVFKEPLTDDEQEAVGIEYYRQCIESFINHNGRMLVVNCDDVSEATPVLAQYSLIDNIAHIKHIIDYEIQWGK